MFLSSFLALKLCSKAISGIVSEYGKSPCFSRSSALSSTDVDGRGSPFTVLNVEVL
jgi:hypothetical protein